MALAVLAAGQLGRGIARRDDPWRRLVDDAPEGFIAIDAQGRIVEWNDTCRRMFGWTRAEATGTSVTELIVPERFRPAQERGLRRYRESGATTILGRPLMLPAVRRDGAELTVELTVTSGRLRGRSVFYAFLHDATDRHRAERYLKAESEVARVLLEGNSLRGAGPQLLAVMGGALEWDAGALWLVDEHEEILRCAHTWSRERPVLCHFLDAMQRVVLARGEGLAGRVWEQLEPEWIDRPELLAPVAAMRGAEIEPVCSVLALPLHSHGQTLGVIEFFHESPYPRDDELLNLTMFIAMHIAGYLDRLRGTDLLQRSWTVARTDELTGLPNRRALNEQLPARMNAASRAERMLCLAMLDLDNFKAFNDLLGHPAGDRLLRSSAVLWRRQLREEDLLARYGGEEFTAVLESPVEQAQEILERLRAATPSGQTCSIGLTQWDREEPPEALIARADGALYRAKHAGRDRIELAGART